MGRAVAKKHENTPCWARIGHETRQARFAGPDLRKLWCAILGLNQPRRLPPIVALSSHDTAIHPLIRT